MGEVDSVFVIKRPHTNLEIHKPFLEKIGLTSAEDFKAILKHGKLMGPDKSGISCLDVLESAYEKTKDPRRIQTVQKYRMHEKLLLDELDRQEENNPFHNKIPIFVNGLCAGRGVDPYSNAHAFSTSFIKTLWENLPESERFPIEFLDLFRFIYVAPVTYIQKPVLHPEKGLGLEDILKEQIREKIDNQIKGIGFGTLEKFDDITPKLGNSEFSSSLLSVKPTLRTLEKMPELLREEVVFEDKVNIPRFLEQRAYEVYINTQVIAIKFAQILDSLSPQVKEMLKKYDIGGIPLFMEKTSASARIMNDAKQHYSTQSLPLKMIGGTEGILGNAPEKVPLEGIAHPSALGKLFGLMANIYRQWCAEQSTASITVPINMPLINVPRIQRQQPLHYDVTRRFPFLLLEEGTKYKHPNLHDLAREILSDYELNLIRNFAIKNRLSFSRVEPRIVSLLKNDALVYQGFRRMSKENTVWFSELRGKKVLTPDSVKGFLEMMAISKERSLRSDFRGSEFSTITSPKINQEWFEKPVEERYLGCSIDKLIARTSNETRVKIIKEQIPFEPAEDVKRVLRLFDKNFNFKPIFLGTAVHKLYSTPLKGLAHYKTLELAGLSPVSSDCYAEIQFNYKVSSPMQEGEKETLVSVKPDAYLLLERNLKEYDIIVIDLKTSRVLQYPEQKYLLQTLFYGWVIEQVAALELSLKIQNIYAVLDKSAFYKTFFGEEKIIPHNTFRQQVFSPITVFAPGNQLREEFPSIIGRIVAEKKMLKADSGAVADYKQRMENEAKACQGCGLVSRMICNYTVRKHQEGQNIFSQVSR